MNLKGWRKEKGWRQADIAAKLGSIGGTYQKWEAGENPIPPDIQAKIRKLGYQGPWPAEETQEAAAPAGGPYVTEKDFAEWVGRVKRLEEEMRALLPLEKAVKDLDARVGAKPPSQEPSE